jgi:hypothetical protein
MLHGEYCMSPDRKKDNTGTGVESIRLGGKSMEELSVVEFAHARQDLPAAYETEKENKIKAIRTKYPKHSINYLTSRVTECEENVKRISTLKIQQQTMISEYNTHVGLCDHRDKELAKLDPVKDGETIKALKIQFPPYNVEAMKRQITQCFEAIERCDNVVAQEYASIAELQGVMGLCLQRDKELQALGEKVG